ncbi:circadian-associated transcriptional repressor-like protein [Lates japonicus]|uniref:Circadian-associated transcriptional repressor-like protein n=1 Tax=Lates japonicus TaxID=270547 RepID=A0AAD3R2M7_LATJO|nr:circadian-associated transcriptional repressor-like protein [Lates japonicus]
MDRIQRILGVLQNPLMGGRFLNIILKIEKGFEVGFLINQICPRQTAAPQQRSRSSIIAVPPLLHRLSAPQTQEVTQDNAVSSSTDSHTLRRLSANPRPRQEPLPFKISSPCLERLLQAKDSIITPRTVGNGDSLMIPLPHADTMSQSDRVRDDL